MARPPDLNLQQKTFIKAYYIINWSVCNNLLNDIQIRKLTLILFALIALSWKGNKSNSLILSDNKQKQDTLKWIDNFRKFRNAVYQNDRIKVRQFIDFPILNENNEASLFVVQ